nr:short integuments 2, mitochondrial [Quercus suber]
MVSLLRFLLLQPAINAHSKTSVNKLLELVEFKLREVISREPTLLVLVIGVPNVGKSALINSIHQISSSRFPVQEKMKRATVGPLPGVTQDIAGYKIAHQPSIYVLDTPGALAGSVKDSVVGEERIAQYLLAVLNTRGTPLHWKHLNNRRLERFRYDSKEKHEYNLKDLRPKRRKPPNDSNMLYVEFGSRDDGEVADLFGDGDEDMVVMLQSEEERQER